MDPQNQNPASCKLCGKSPARRCTGCFDPESINPQSTPAFYCSKEYLKQDWSSHKDACHAAQLEKVATKKLFRAGELLQEAFLATRAEVFDINIERVQKLHESGRLIIFDGPLSDPGPISFSGDPEDRAALLSFNAGGDVFRRMMHEFGLKASEGKSSIVTVNEVCQYARTLGYVAKAEEVDVQILVKQGVLVASRGKWRTSTLDLIATNPGHLTD